MTVDELQSTLVVHEQKFRRMSTEGEDHVLKIEDRAGARGRGRTLFFRGRGRGRGRTNFNKATVECYKCHNLGHFQYECPTWQKEANYAELEEDDELLLMAYVELHETTRKDAWFVDSGCSNHMCGNPGMFTSLDTSFSHSVKLGNNTRMMVIGKGVVKIMFDGITYSIGNVYCVPELKNNLLSVGQLQEKGVAVLFQDGVCKLFHPQKGKMAESIMSANRMFILLAESSVSAVEDKCLQTSTMDQSKLWHHRYGHLSYKGLCTLHSKNMVVGLPQITPSSNLCDACMKGKQHRTVIPKVSRWRATERLQLVHADLCGPINPISRGKKRYLLCLIDDFSRKTWVYFLLEKSEVFYHFKCFKILVEKEIGLSIKCLRTDRGGEFNSAEFNEFCMQHGVKRQLTTAYTPQQNGVAERKNRTVMNMVRAMLSEKKVPKSFWPEATRWCIHVLNRSPTLVVKNMTPEEAWSGEKPSVDHFRVFGCVGYVHIPDARRIKLDDKSVSCVLLGYSEKSKGYKMYDPVGDKVIISRDVVFEEDRMCDWDTNYEKDQLMELEWGDIDEQEAAEIEGEGGVGDVNVQEEEVEREINEADVVAPAREENLVVREGRIRRAPIWTVDYVSGEGLSEEEEANMALMVTEDPTTFEEAVQSSKWRQAMNEEIESIEKNQTWNLVELPTGGKRIGVKWVYKTKLNELGEVSKYKARLVVKGYSQQHGIDYTEVYAPVARMDTVRMIIALTAQKGWKLHQLDVKSAFLHGELKEDVYVEQPKGYEKKGSEQKVYKLQKALYGLKQAPRAWFSRIESYFIKEGFKCSPSEQTLFIKRKEGKILIVSVYVDDLMFTSNDDEMLNEFKRSMKREFEMTDLGELKFFLGIEVLQRSDGIFICQRKYATEVLERFGMAESNSVRNPIVPGQKICSDECGAKVDATLFKQMVGSLMYLTATRPDLMFVVCLISRYMGSPTQLHFAVAKRILRYLQGTVDHGVYYKRDGASDLVGFTDSDYAGDIEDSKSTSGYVFMMSGGAVAWSSRKQPIVTLSSTEAEFVAAVACACQAVWMRKVLKEISHDQTGSTLIMCDNTSAIKLSKNAVFHGRTKHMRVRYHFLRDLTKECVVQMMFCGSQDQLADLMTKPLKFGAFKKLREELGMCAAPDVN
ncbi:hypothetical protein M0R45_025465 [Rubus argutus]|uniref:Retrovirus-related Pol polyprotein from transposon TNT 1-94 n=1 Tax=Rubus argutus TaxID=59490 RepID=A0AAW1WY51_RUBAR